MKRSTFLSLASLAPVAALMPTLDEGRVVTIPTFSGAPNDEHGISYIFKGPGSSWTQDPLNQRCTIGAKWVGSNGLQYGIWFYCEPFIFEMACREMRERIALQYRDDTEAHIKRGEASPYELTEGKMPPEIVPTFSPCT